MPYLNLQAITKSLPDSVTEPSTYPDSGAGLSKTTMSKKEGVSINA